MTIICVSIAYIENLFIEKDFIECFLNLRQYIVAAEFSHSNMEMLKTELSAYNNNTRSLVLTDIK